MIRRLVEAHCFANQTIPDSEKFHFWFQELRTPGLLMDCARAWLEAAKPATQTRPLLSLAITEDEPALTTALNDEEQTERLKDKAYWLPLKQKLEKMRMDR